MSKLMVAYGSNLNKRQMRRRAPSARPLGQFMMKNWRLVFRGVADIEYSPGDKVPCGLYLISRADERALDGFEGISMGHYFKDESMLLKYDGKKQHALVYLMTSEGVYPPSQTYVDTIRQGYKDFGLDESYLEAAIERAFTDKDPDAQTRRRRQRQKTDAMHYKLVALPKSVAQRRLEMQKPLDWGLAKGELKDGQKAEQARQRPPYNRWMSRSRQSTGTPARPIEDATRLRHPPFLSDERPDPASQERLTRGWWSDFDPGSLFRRERKHQPSWPTIGPDSKLLPKPNAEKGNPDQRGKRRNEDLKSWRERVQRLAR